MLNPEFTLRIEDGISNRPGPSKDAERGAYRFSSKLSKDQLRAIARAFALDKTPQQCAEESGVSLKTIYTKYAEIRYVFAEGARYRTDRFSGAGVLLLLGVPPFDVREQVLEYKDAYRIRKPFNYIELFERLIRIYARWQLSDEVRTALSVMALFRVAPRRGYEKNVLDFLRIYGRFQVVEDNWTMGVPEDDPLFSELWKIARESPQHSRDSYRRMVERDLRWLMDRCPLAVPSPQWRLENSELSPDPARMKELLARIQAARQMEPDKAP